VPWAYALAVRLSVPASPWSATRVAGGGARSEPAARVLRPRGGLRDGVRICPPAACGNAAAAMLAIVRRIRGVPCVAAIAGATRRQTDRTDLGATPSPCSARSTDAAGSSAATVACALRRGAWQCVTMQPGCTLGFVGRATGRARHAARLSGRWSPALDATCRPARTPTPFSPRPIRALLTPPDSE